LWRLPEPQINCSCGSTFANDAFWRETAASGGCDPAMRDELRELEARVCRSGFIARHRFSLVSLAADPQVRRFLELQFRMFEAVAQQSDSAVLVDSSKAGPRAWLLACDPRVRIVHLFRDPGDVMASWRSTKFDPGMGRAMKRMSIRAAALDWWKVEHLIRRLARERPVSRLDYRAFCDSPQSELAGLIAGLGIESAISPAWIAADAVDEGEHYHSLNGNPDRFVRGPIRIAARAADWSKVGGIDRPLIRATAELLRTISPPAG
jgi:hypothetical protein